MARGAWIGEAPRMSYAVRPRAVLLVLLLLAALSSLSACGDDDDAPAVDAGHDATPSADAATDAGTATIDVLPDPDLFCPESCRFMVVGDTRKVVAIVRDAAGTELDVPVTWSSADDTIASIDAAGLVTAHQVAESLLVTAHATIDGAAVEGSLELVIQPRPVKRIEVTPPSASIVTLGGTQAFTATAYDDLDQVVTGVAFFWGVGNAAVADVDADGKVTGVAQGATIVQVGTELGGFGWAKLTVVAPVSATPGLALTELVGGLDHSCGVTAAGTVLCWGWNYWGQLGNGTLTDELSFFPVPAPITGEHALGRVDGSESHTCALEAGGKAWCWGLNSHGSLGTVPAIDPNGSPDPVAVDGGLVFRSLSTGYDTTCGVTSDDHGYCWGYGAYGATGTGTFEDSAAPEAVAGDHAWKQIVSGLWHSCGITTAGVAYCWGSNEFGQLGVGGEDLDGHHTPVAVSGAHVFTQIDTQASHTCGVDPSGVVWCWGRNETGAVGNGTVSHGATLPVKVDADDPFVRVTTGVWHTCAITGAGEAWCWGLNDSGQLGDLTLDSSSQPVLVAGELAFASISMGGFHSCGLTGDGKAYCWGENGDGELGDGGGGQGTMSPVPWPVVAPEAP
jgi:alpha-tubulin suppressor-like RCC1 family protein